MQVGSEPAVPHNHADDAEFEAYLNRLERDVHAAVKGGQEPLFVVEPVGGVCLWETYLTHFLSTRRQYHNCHACQRFIKKYGGLVTIRGGRTSSIFWNTQPPEEMAGSVAALRRYVETGKVVGVFYDDAPFWGTRMTGVWTHLSVRPPVALITEKPEKEMAEKKHDFENVRRALTQFSVENVDTALSLLDSDVLYRAEKVRGPAVWLRDLMRDTRTSPNARDTIWRAVATAPPGFAHVQSSMIGTLLGDIQAGMSFETISRRFAAKMRPDVYQRPTAPPKDGQIEAAERKIAELKSAGALARRVARLDEIQTLWRRQDPATPDTKGVFGHLRHDASRESAKLTLPPQIMTWARFQKVVLPTAQRIEILASAHGNYVGFVTAVHPEAPPILQWDTPTARNPVSTYVYTSGSLAKNWNLNPDTYYDVYGVAAKPDAWQRRFRFHHFAEAAIFLIEGARDMRNPGLALFPETLHSDYHDIRAVIEAHSRVTPLEDFGKPQASGLVFNNNGVVHLRVHSAAGIGKYTLDRWE